MVKEGSMPETTERPMLAYTVSEDGDDHAVVVFARSGAEGRRKGAGRLDLTFEEVDSCRRAPEFDAYAEAGRVPPLAMIDAGWWFECSHCGHQITSDREGPEGEDLEPVADGDAVYCNTAHLMAEWRERRDRQARENAAIEACATRFHHLPLSGLRGNERYTAGGRDIVACCDFDFPGRKGMLARWDLGGSEVHISECDRAAWAAMTETKGRS